MCKGKWSELSRLPLQKSRRWFRKHLAFALTTLSLSLSHTHMHSHNFSVAHTHTHTHSLSLSFSFLFLMVFCTLLCTLYRSREQQKNESNLNDDGNHRNSNVYLYRMNFISKLHRLDRLLHEDIQCRSLVNILN